MLKRVIEMFRKPTELQNGNLPAIENATPHQKCNELNKTLRLGRHIISTHDHSLRFNLSGDKLLFLSIVDDMFLNGGDLAPSGSWTQCSVSPNDFKDMPRQMFVDTIFQIFSSRFSTMQQFMDPWVGIIGMNPVSDDQIQAYSPLLERIDQCGLMGDDLSTTANAQGMLNTDLGSLMDVNFIANLTPLQSGKRFSVLEVGGGYGRLAEALTNGLDSCFHYVLVDAIPASLMYAKAYLEKAFPSKKIGFYTTDRYDTSYDFFILPPWHLDKIKSTSFDLCINIESMQEMEQAHIDFYLKTFDELSKENACIYISNSRSYIFKGNWNFPDYWQLVLCQNTPRSWTIDHPTLLFRKSKEISIAHNRLIEGLHAHRVYLSKPSSTVAKELQA